MAKRIGEFLVELGVLTEKQVTEVLRHAKATGLRFGEAAVHLGMLRTETAVPALDVSYDIDFFHLNPRYFPAITRELLPKETVLKYGMLPLGFKNHPGLLRQRKFLNLGFLDPTQKEKVQEGEKAARTAAGESCSGTKVYLVLADEFLDVLSSVYGVSEESLREKPFTEVDPSLMQFLESTAANPS